MPLNAQAVTPPTLDVSAEDASSPSAPTKDLPANVPRTPDNLVAGKIPAVAQAGVDLATKVLYIAAGVIVMLMLYLAWMEHGIAGNVSDAYKQVLNPSKAGSEFYTLDRLEQFASDLNAARTDSNKTMSKETAQRDQDVIKMLGELPSLTTTQKAQLNQCVPLPTDPSRSEKLGQCITVADNVRQAALGSAASTMTAQMAGEAAGKIQDHRTSFHQFWIQAAQLILLNLLLPLLTALFGYIFGTQQATGKNG